MTLGRTAQLALNGLKVFWPWLDRWACNGWRIQQHVRHIRKFRLLDPSGNIVARGSRKECSYAFKKLNEEKQVSWRSSKLVLFLHGMGRLQALFLPLRDGVESHGYASHIYHYPCWGGDLELQTSRLRLFLASLTGIEEISFVTQSYGALIVRNLLTQSSFPDLGLKIGRVVMIVPPNQGAWPANVAARVPILKDIVGSSGWSVSTNAAQTLGVPDVPTKIVAGNCSHIAKFLPLNFLSQTDLLVSINQTRLPAIPDPVVIPMTHFFSANHPKTVDEGLSFLAS